MRFSKLCLCAVCLVCSLLICSCSDSPTIESDPLLKAPRLPGDMYDIQQTLDASVSTPYTLKYPTSGQYKSAVTLMDITNDGKNEAIAFYSTTSNDVTSISLSFLINQDGEWYSMGDSRAYASSIEQVLFNDLDGDGLLEIIVGWVMSPTDKHLAVYSYQNNSLVQRLQESYTSFICCNLNSDKTDDLMIINLDTAQSSSRATLYGFTSDGVATIGSCSLDGGVTSYSVPVISTLPDKRDAIYVDAVKGAGTLTEILFFEKGAFINGTFDQLSGATNLTFRSSGVAIDDINADGVPEIPIQLEFKGVAGLNENDKTYFTHWCDYTLNGLKRIKVAYMNYADNYSFELPSAWDTNVTARKDSKKRLCSFYEWNSKKEQPGKLLLQLAAIAEATWNSDSSYSKEGFVQIAKADGLVYAAKCPNTDSPLAIDIEQVKKSFEIIDRK